MEHEHIHGHDHDHEHAHTHEHHHDHDHHHHHHHEHGEVSMEQLCALMKYMVDHNAAHAGELADLAHQLEHAGKMQEVEKVMAAVEDFNRGNRKLAEVLQDLA